MAALPRRILKETQKLTQDPVPGIEAIPDEKNARYFHIKVFGPADSPYENGKRVWGYREELGSRWWNWKFREKAWKNQDTELLLHSSYSFLTLSYLPVAAVGT